MSVLLVLSGCNSAGWASTLQAPTRTQPPLQSAPIRAFISESLTCRPTDFFSDKSLVLATDRLTYDQAEVNQLTAFIDSQGTPFLRTDGPSLPETLRYITGSAPISIISQDDPGSEQVTSTPCSVLLEVTNISKETLQIPQVRLRYLRDAGPNTQLYRLINVCSVGVRAQNQNSGICPYPGGGPQQGYGVGFTIGRGPADIVYSDKPQPIGPEAATMPAIPTLTPGGAAEIIIETDVKNDDSGFFVSALPEVVVTFPDKTQTIALTQLHIDIAIAAPRNVSCYTLQGDTFVQQKPLISGQESSWCV